jgi:hypothetical protein
MLGTLQMDIDMCIYKDLELVPLVFPKEGFVSASKFARAFKGAAGLARFDPQPLEKAVKEFANAKFSAIDPSNPFDALKVHPGDAPGKVQVI